MCHGKIKSHAKKECYNTLFLISIENLFIINTCNNNENYTYNNNHHQQNIIYIKTTINETYK